MSSVNKVILIGNVGQDPEIRDVNGAKVANFSLATSESWKDKTSGERKTETQWHNIVVWRQLAEIVEKFVKKGSKIYVEGKLTTRSYDKQDGSKAYVTEVIVNNMTMLDSPSQPQQQPQQQPTQQAAAVEETEDDLPF